MDINQNKSVLSKPPAGMLQEDLGATAWKDAILTDRALNRYHDRFKEVYLA